MTYQFKLQVPISKKLNSKVKKRANEMGFASVSDVVRLLLTGFANGDLSLSFVEAKSDQKTVTKQLESIIAKGIEEYKHGKTKKINLSKLPHFARIK